MNTKDAQEEIEQLKQRIQELEAIVNATPVVLRAEKIELEIPPIPEILDDVASLLQFLFGDDQLPHSTKKWVVTRGKGKPIRTEPNP